MNFQTPRTRRAIRPRRFVLLHRARDQRLEDDLRRHRRALSQARHHRRGIQRTKTFPERPRLQHTQPKRPRQFHLVTHARTRTYLRSPSASDSCRHQRAAQLQWPLRCECLHGIVSQDGAGIRQSMNSIALKWLMSAGAFF